MFAKAIVAVMYIGLVAALTFKQDPKEVVNMIQYTLSFAESTEIRKVNVEQYMESRKVAEQSAHSNGIDYIIGINDIKSKKFKRIYCKKTICAVNKGSVYLRTIIILLFWLGIMILIIKPNLFFKVCLYIN